LFIIIDLGGEREEKKEKGGFKGGDIHNWGTWEKMIYRRQVINIIITNINFTKDDINLWFF
jgi:hypothetical protein